LLGLEKKQSQKIARLDLLGLQFQALLVERLRFLPLTRLVKIQCALESLLKD